MWMGGKLVSSASAGSIQASAELVVPRSMPIFIYVTRSRTLNSSFQRRPSRATHHSCSMPVSVITVSNETGTVPVASAEVSFTSMGESSSSSSPKVFDQRAWRIVLAHGGGEEAELGRLADDQAELAIWNRHRRSFFHAERGDGEGLERRGHTGHGGHGALDADIVRARYAAANAHAFAVARQAVISRAARDRMHEIFTGERLDGVETFLGQPAVENANEAVAHEARMQDAAIEQNMRGRGQAGWAAADALVLGGRGLLAQESRQVPGDGGVGGIGQSDFLQAEAALALRQVGAGDVGKEAFASMRSTSSR